MRSIGNCRCLAVTALVGMLAAPVWAQESAPPAAADAIDRSVRELSSAEYVVRDQATRRLIAAGSGAVPAVQRIIAGGDWEATTRGIFVLRELALSGDETTEQLAQQALQQAAADQARPAGRQAAEALAVLVELRQQRALDELAGRGAVVDPDYSEMGLTPGGIFAVQFGPQFQGGPADLRRLRWLRDVEQVVFDGPQITDDWIRHLEGMEGLTFLKIRRASITNAALQTLKELPRLRYVKLLYVDIGDGAVEHLQHCKQIARLLAYGTELSEQGAQRLKAEGVDVDLRKGAFLGISVPRPNDGDNWFINQVTPNSAAEQAGLEPGDVITQFGGQPVRDFSSLMDLIAAHDAGEAIPVEIRRRGEIFIKQITLVEWE